MPACGPNTLIIGKTSSFNTQGVSCAPTCDNAGPADCLKTGLSPRRNRGAVIQQIKDYVLLMLGAPVIEIELDDQQLDLAVKQTLKIIEYYAPKEFFRYYTFITTPGKSVYEMPPDIGYIRNVYYRQTAEYAFQASDLGGAIPIEYFSGAYATPYGGFMDPVQPMYGRAADWLVSHTYNRMFSRMSSALGGWEWIAASQTSSPVIKLYPIPMRAHHVIVWYMQICADFSEVTLAMQEGALIHAKLMLGMIRKKFVSPPGPGGGIQLDGQEMYTTALEEMKSWREDLIYKFGDLLPISMG